MDRYHLSCIESTSEKKFLVCTPEKVDSLNNADKSQQRLEGPCVVRVTKPSDSRFIEKSSFIDRSSGTQMSTNPLKCQSSKYYLSKNPCCWSVCHSNSLFGGLPKIDSLVEVQRLDLLSKEHSYNTIPQASQPTFHHQSHDKMYPYRLNKASSPKRFDFPLTLQEGNCQEATMSQEISPRETINTVVSDKVITLLNNFQHSSSFPIPPTTDPKNDSSRYHSQSNFPKNFFVRGIPYGRTTEQQHRNGTAALHNQDAPGQKPFLCPSSGSGGESKLSLSHRSMSHSIRDRRTVDTSFARKSSVDLAADCMVSHDSCDKSSLTHLSQYNPKRCDIFSLSPTESSLSHDNEHIASLPRWCFPHFDTVGSSGFDVDSLSHSVLGYPPTTTRQEKRCSFLSVEDTFTRGLKEQSLSPSYETSYSGLSNQNFIPPSDTLTRLLQVDSRQHTPNGVDSESSSLSATLPDTTQSTIKRKPIELDLEATQFEQSLKNVFYPAKDQFIYKDESLSKTFRTSVLHQEALSSHKTAEHSEESQDPLQWLSAPGSSSTCIGNEPVDTSPPATKTTAEHGTSTHKTRGTRGKPNAGENTQTAQLTLIVNVPTTTTRQDLLNAFRVFGQVLMPTVVCRRETRHPKKEWTATAGYAFVLFRSKSSAQAALAATDMGRVVIRGTSVKATWAKKDSFCSQSVEPNNRLAQHSITPSSATYYPKNFNALNEAPSSQTIMSKSFLLDEPHSRNDSELEHSQNTLEHWKAFLHDSRTLKDEAMNTLCPLGLLNNHTTLDESHSTPQASGDPITSSHPRRLERKEAYLQWLNLSIPDLDCVSPSMLTNHAKCLVPSHSPFLTHDDNAPKLFPYGESSESSLEQRPVKENQCGNYLATNLDQLATSFIHDIPGETYYGSPTQLFPKRFLNTKKANGPIRLSTNKKYDKSRSHPQQYRYFSTVESSSVHLD